MRTRLVTIAILLLTLIVCTNLTGCGRKGGLYLPENVKSDEVKTITAPVNDER